MKETKAEHLSDALAALRRGDVIVFPTETLYGLGADALNVSAVAKVFQLKGRDSSNPFPVLVSNRSMLNSLVADIPPLAEKLIARFWPGPLTIVIPARKDIPRALMNSAGNIGVRISSHPLANELVSLFGHPLTATSANPSREPAARTVEKAKEYFTGTIDIFIDGGELTSNAGSTVAEVTGNRLRVIREGKIGKYNLEQATGKGVILE